MKTMPLVLEKSFLESSTMKKNMELHLSMGVITEISSAHGDKNSTSAKQQ
jgi:hypothetical protein